MPRRPRCAAAQRRVQKAPTRRAGSTATHGSAGGSAGCWLLPHEDHHHLPGRRGLGRLLRRSVGGAGAPPARGGRSAGRCGGRLDRGHPRRRDRAGHGPRRSGLGRGRTGAVVARAPGHVLAALRAGHGALHARDRARRPRGLERPAHRLARRHAQPLPGGPRAAQPLGRHATHRLAALRPRRDVPDPHRADRRVRHARCARPSLARRGRGGRARRRAAGVRQRPRARHAPPSRRVRGAAAAV